MEAGINEGMYSSGSSGSVGTVFLGNCGSNGGSSCNSSIATSGIVSSNEKDCSKLDRSAVGALGMFIGMFITGTAIVK